MKYCRSLRRFFLCSIDSRESLEYLSQYYFTAQYMLASNVAVLYEKLDHGSRLNIQPRVKSRQVSQKIHMINVKELQILDIPPTFARSAEKWPLRPLLRPRKRRITCYAYP